MQTAVQAVSQHTPFAQWPVEQSLSTEHFLPWAQVAHAGPPQSTSVSFPSFVTSSQEIIPPHSSLCVPHVAPKSAHVFGVQHFPPLHFPPEQSDPCEHFESSGHAGQEPPPQSTSVSLPFGTLSVQLAAAHSFIEHTPLSQSLPWRQATHAPASLHIPAPASPVQAAPTVTPCVLVLPFPSQTSSVHVPPDCPGTTVPSATGATPHTFPAQMAVWHGFSGAGQSLTTHPSWILSSPKT